jgi:hypothetical protein
MPSSEPRAAGAHEFDRLCAELGIEHRLTPPASPRTNGMVERFNGRIEEVLQGHHFRSGEDLETTLHRYVRLYNQQLPQSALGSKSPLQAMKGWHKLKPQLFRKQPYYLPGCDSYGNSSGFGLHSGYHTSIRPAQWREGKYSFGRLTARDWEFIDIRVARFLVKAIWPDYIPGPVWPTQGAADAIYSTPYLDLVQAAIAHFGITAEDQGKKDCLVDWFLEQEIEGEPVSNKLADAMATLIRLPSAQRGGAKRVLGPDLRQTA